MRARKFIGAPKKNQKLTNQFVALPKPDPVQHYVDRRVGGAWASRFRIQLIAKMSDAIHSRQVTVRNPQGLHMRPADMLVKTASQYSARIEIERGGQAVNGKSILDILMLGAQQGCELVLRASGDDAEEALNKLVELFENGFFEADAEVVSPPPA